MLWFLSSSWNSLMSQQLGHITQLYSWSIFRYFHTGNSVAILSQLPACLPEKNHRSCCSCTIVVEYSIFNEAGKRTGGVSADGCLHRILFNFFRIQIRSSSEYIKFMLSFRRQATTSDGRTELPFAFRALTRLLLFHQLKGFVVLYNSTLHTCDKMKAKSARESGEKHNQSQGIKIPPRDGSWFR